MSTRIVLIGAAGRMGRSMARLLGEGRVEGLELAGAVDLSTNPGQGEDLGLLAGTRELGVPLTADLPALKDAGDVFIDFSFHHGIAERMQVLGSWRKAIVVGTTGLDAREQAAVEAVGRSNPVVYAPNMSLGINLLHSLVEQAARALKGKGYDIEVIERHHRRKLDAPSGTALFLGEAAAKGSDWTLSEVAKDGRSGMSDGDRPEAEIGFHAVRGGDFAGDHTVIFAAEGESIELHHRATSRDTFAAGALRAAAWLNGQPAGLYRMQDVLGL